MGKGTIVSGGVAGSYQISLDYGKATQTAKLAALAARLAELVGLLADAQGNLNTQEIIDAPLLVAVEDAVAAYVAATEATRAKALANHSAALIKHTEALRKQAPLRLAWQLLKDEQAQALKDQIYWQNLVLEETVQAWCADYTEDATGFVATVEIPGENKRVLIAPAAPAPLATHGLLTAREVQTPAQVFLNAAILPGWQKHKPTYRRGTITDINTDADTASVTLEVADTSSAQGLNINQAATLTAVPVKYMTCNAAAFEVGDRCVVMFKTQDWAQPEIIGFVDNPKPCELILSGVVKGGTLSDLPIPPGSPPGTLAKKTLNTFKPTANCWQYPLKSAADKSPSAFSAEPLLGKAGTQYVDLAASMFTGLMAKAVQIIMGMGLPVAYDYTWARCHGLTLASDGKPWLIEISIANGVLAMPFKVATGSPTSPVDAVTACKALLGGIPANTTFPTGAALTAAIAAGTVLQLLDTAAMTGVHGKSAYSPTLGWSFSPTGHEAHNTCYYTPSGTLVHGCHYKLVITINPADGSGAALSLVSEGRLVGRTQFGYPIEPSPVNFYNHTTNSMLAMPREVIAGASVTSNLTATVLASYVNGVLDLLQVKTYIDEPDESDSWTSAETNSYVGSRTYARKVFFGYKSQVTSGACATGSTGRTEQIVPQTTARFGSGLVYLGGSFTPPNWEPMFARQSFTYAAETSGALTTAATVPGVRDGYFVYEQQRVDSYQTGGVSTNFNNATKPALAPGVFVYEALPTGTTPPWEQGSLFVVPTSGDYAPGVTEYTVYPAKLHTVLPTGLITQTIPTGEEADALAWWKTGTRAGLAAAASLFGPHPHHLYTRSPWAVSPPGKELVGDLLAAETTPSANHYAFLGYL